MSSTTTRSVTHDTFTLERRYDATPARVFAAFADQEAKKQWFGGGDDWTSDRWDLDFRVGGREVNHSHMEGGPAITFEATFQDIIENERIVYAYDMTMDGERISVSLATIELFGDGGGCRLVLTEQGAFLDGLDKPEMRREGTEQLLDALGASLGA
jgi:uncharacterized protein YndB with AHSA1/START domain